MTALPESNVRRTLRAQVLGRATSFEAIAIGVMGTLLVHALLATLAPGLLLRSASWLPAVPARAAAALPVPQRFEFVLVPPEAAPAPPRYMEVNPDAPVAEPDTAELFSYQDQQAASPEPVPGERDAPRVEGVDQQTGRLLAGDVEYRAPEPVTEAAPPSQIVRPRPDLAPQDPAEEPPSEAPEMAESGEPVEEAPAEPVVEADGIRFPEQRAPVTGTTRPLLPDWAAQQLPEQPALPQRDAAPQPRRQIQNTVLPGEVEAMAGGARRVGLVAVNARFNEYGEYLRRMFEAIQVQWYRLIEGKVDALVFPSQVDVRFVIDREGRVLEVEVLRTNAGLIGTLITRDAVQARSPFGPFSEEMRRNLGETEEIVVYFRYL